MSNQPELPIQSVEKPILCGPFDEPNDHWLYERETGQAYHAGRRREAGYWYKTETGGASQQYLPGLTQEQFEPLPLVNLLRDDVRRWREADYRGASSVTKDLLRHWASKDRDRRLFFCQREAVETIIYLAELRIPGKSSRTGFQKFGVTDEDIRLLLGGQRPTFPLATTEALPALVDKPFDNALLPLRRMGCKMATGSGKTVVMAMLIAWAFCNRAQNPNSAEFPNAVLVCCPNLTVKERLQVLRPENAENYYAAFDIVPLKYRPLLQSGKVMVENWHRFAPESEHKEGDRTYAVVNKGPETPDTFARRALGDLYERMPVMILNDEGHHCWRPAAAVGDEELTGDEKRELAEEAREATVWIEGLDRLNNAPVGNKPGVALCVDLSATPFYIKGSGYPEGRPFPWLVSDFGLVDAIESGIVKIPRLPVQDVTGRPEPKYFRLWEAIKENRQPAEYLSGKARKLRPDVIYRETEGALKQIAGQWVERFKYIEQASPNQDRVPPVLIIVCDNTDLAEIFFRKISGEHEVEALSEKPKTRTVYEPGEIFPEYFSNTPALKRTIRIDSKLLAEAESEDPNKRKQELADELRRVVATVGKAGQPGEHVRCVVSVSMLTEGWDANNVTHILGVRAFGSQLLCEQVVGRGLRRMDYTVNADGRLSEEYVDVYGIPFSVIPFKGRPVEKAEPADKPKQHVRALPERALLEIRFPVVEGYAFALHKNLIRCDVAGLATLSLEPGHEPTATFLSPQVGVKEGSSITHGSLFPVIEQTRETYYSQTHLQTIKFQIARLVMERLLAGAQNDSDRHQQAFRFKSRHQLFPQVYRVVDEYVRQRVDFHGCDECELGLERYVKLLVERLHQNIEPDEAEGEPPLLPILYRYQPMGTTADVDFKTTRPCFATHHSHINQVAADTQKWEQSAAFRIEQCCLQSVARCYARNDQLGFRIPYEYLNVSHFYEPDYLVELNTAKGKLTLILEIKGYSGNQENAKHDAVKRWVKAVNNWGQLGRWDFHVCHDPQLLERELKAIASAQTAG